MNGLTGVIAKISYIGGVAFKKQKGSRSFGPIELTPITPDGCSKGPPESPGHAADTTPQRRATHIPGFKTSKSLLHRTITASSFCNGFIIILAGPDIGFDPFVEFVIP
uniref:Uncharacterized protein n=1 Tax=Heliothis virescens TaxID=7102 RepID=A0A2A4JBA9_HELVI